MKFLRELHAKIGKHFEKGGKLERLYPLFEAHDTFVFATGETTSTAPHIRDGVDLKRLMITVVIAVFPCMLMAMFNTGYQVHLAVTAPHPAEPLDNIQTHIFQALGFDFKNMGVLACFVYGSLYFIPIYLVTLIAGGFWEVLFACVRRHEINEGFLVTSALFPLLLPPTVPLWQVALAISFGVVIAKEMFGGVGMNFFNPALAARAFLYFAYPAQISGDSIWIAAKTSADGYSGATWLAVAKEHGMQGLTQGIEGLTNGTLTWWQSFIGLEPGSMGETSALLCLIGALILVITKVASWRTMAGMLVGSFAMASIFNMVGGDRNDMFNVPFYWHWTLGGFAFAAAFMAPDPVTSPFSELGRFIYGCCIGVLGILIRVLNPAYPGSWMLAILFMNMFAPFIDYVIVRANVKRRTLRYAA